MAPPLESVAVKAAAVVGKVAAVVVAVGEAVAEPATEAEVVGAVVDYWTEVTVVLSPWSL